MINRRFVMAAAVLAAGLRPLVGDVVELRDRAAITGQILAEKKDVIAVDVGYTVLTIPRSQVVRVQREAGAPEKPSRASRKSTAAVGEARPAPTPPEAGDSSAFFTAARGLRPDRSVRDLVQELGEAVVQVRTPSGLGSGFFLNEEGYLITNFHVIEGETQIGIEVYHVRDGQLRRTVYKQVRIVAMNKFADLALLKIEDADAPRFKRVELGDLDALAVGERVFAIGSPLGLERTVTEGIVSTKTREFQGELYLQTTAQINPGNSGGPLFNLRGEVVGVTNMKLAFGEGLGFAIPVEAVKYFLKHRDSFAYDTDNPSNAYRYLEPPSRFRLSLTNAPDATPSR
ncbi:MAG TPA: trypsin-like peptidase domain-containing protein [Methylomirabilota bacterium]|nr:trypsin-like peptidase domain-containing protein [Methylomirabilota bacterium]